MMRRIKKVSCVLTVFGAIALFTVSVDAATWRYLDYKSANNYSRYYHEDVNILDPYYWKYLGNVSVKGSEWISQGTSWLSSKNAYITMTEPNQNITQSATVTSTGPYDSVIRTDSFILNDYAGPSERKTTASGYVTTYVVDTGGAFSIDLEAGE